MKSSIAPIYMDSSVTPYFDREGAKTKFTVDCIKCQIQKMIDEGLRGPGRNKGGCHCQIIGKDCPWVLTSHDCNGNNRSAPSSIAFREYGFSLIKENSTYIIGKEHFLFYMYHQTSGWSPPPFPERNRMNAIVNPETDCWEMAHINGLHWDDSKINLMWLLKSEHGLLEPNKRRILNPTTLREAGIF